MRRFNQSCWGEDISDLRILKRYQGWRQIKNLTILGFTDFLDRIFSNTWLPAVIVRRFGLWLLRTLPPLKGQTPPNKNVPGSKMISLWGIYLL